jgi:hypothetical protein
MQAAGYVQPNERGSALTSELPPLSFLSRGDQMRGRAVIRIRVCIDLV